MALSAVAHNTIDLRPVTFGIEISHLSPQLAFMLDDFKLAIPDSGLSKSSVHLNVRSCIPEYRDPPVRLFHPSFRNFLLNAQRCKNGQFRINEKIAHNDLVKSCLKVISNALKRDTCSLQMPGALTSEVESNTVSRYLPVHVQYACRYWVDHLQRGEIGLCGGIMRSR